LKSPTVNLKKWANVCRAKMAFDKVLNDVKNKKKHPTNKPFEELEKSDALRVRVERVVLQDLASSPYIMNDNLDFVEQSQFSRAPTATGPTYKELNLPIHLNHKKGEEFPPRAHSIDIQMTALPGIGMKWFIEWMGHVHELSTITPLSQSGLSEMAHPTDPSKACRWKDTPDGMILESVSAKFQNNNSVTFDITWDWPSGKPAPKTWGESNLFVWVQKDGEVSNKVTVIEKNTILPAHEHETETETVTKSEPTEETEEDTSFPWLFVMILLCASLLVCFVLYRIYSRCRTLAGYDLLEDTNECDPLSTNQTQTQDQDFF